jgi:hypothetical protein
MSQYGFCTHLRLTFAGTMKSEDMEEINLLTMIPPRFRVAYSSRLGEMVYGSDTWGY